MLVVKHKVNTKLPIIEVEADMVIFEAGESDETMYFLLEGGVKIYTGQNNTEHVIAEIKKHEFFGDTEMYSHTPRSVSAKTTSPSKLVLIRSESEFEHFVTENRWLSGKIMETMSERLAQANASLATKILGSAVKMELNPDIKPEDKSARRIIRR